MAARPSFAPIRNARPAHHVARDVARAHARAVAPTSFADRLFSPTTLAFAGPLFVAACLLGALAFAVLAMLPAFEAGPLLAFERGGFVLDFGLSLDDCVGLIVRHGSGSCIPD